jgi:hypothetical protein
MHNQYSSSKARSRPRHHHRGFSLPPPRHPQHFLLLLLVMPYQVQRPCIHDLFHCELDSCCFFVVHLPLARMIINIGLQPFRLCL